MKIISGTVLVYSTKVILKCPKSTKKLKYDLHISERFLFFLSFWCWKRRGHGLKTHLRKRKLSVKLVRQLMTNFQLLSNDVKPTDSIRSDEIKAKEKVFNF